MVARNPSQMLRHPPRWWSPCLLFLLGSLLSRAAALEPVTVRSQSGQFIVRGLPQGPPASGYSTSSVSYLRLDPSLTAVSLDRIRLALATELGLGEKWSSPIHVNTRPVRAGHRRITITSVQYQDGWGYHLDVPELVEKPAFYHAAVKVILLEFAHRQAVAREAELPPWLVNGLVQELQFRSLLTLALEPQTSIRASGAAVDPLALPRTLLRARPALTFSQLSLPSEDEETEEAGELYRVCSYFLVHELLRLRHGPQSLRAMLTLLPGHLNWQTAFLQAFPQHFPRLIDVDKWFAVSVVHLTGRERQSVWPLDVSLEHLDQILRTSVSVRLERNELPIPTEVGLQRIIAELDFNQLRAVLEQKRAQLDALQLRSAPELVDLVRDYFQALDAYLNQLGANDDPAKPRKRKRSDQTNARNAIRRLDILEHKLGALRLKLGPVPDMTDGRVIQP